jgi:hypothetical protein
MDANKFEDECRLLFGAGAYCLFTLDKLIAQLVKHTQALFKDEGCMKVLSLFQYEHKWAQEDKTDGMDEAARLQRSGQLARMYQANCQALIGDEMLVQVEFFEDSHELGTTRRRSAQSERERESAKREREREERREIE